MTSARPPDVLVIANEPVWPANAGGRVRTAALIESLIEAGHQIVTAEPADSDELGGTAPRLRRTALPTDRVAWPRQVLSAAPRLGHSALGHVALTHVLALVHELRPAAILCTHSYVAAMLPALSVPLAVDFQNIERERSVSLATAAPVQWRAVHLWEAAKASRWEPRVARQADLPIAITSADASTLSQWGAQPVIVPNGATVDRSRLRPSEADAAVVFLGSAGHAPNVDAVRLLVTGVWPEVRRRVPSARLRIVGRGGEHAFAWARGMPGIEVVGTVPDVSAELIGSTLVVAPVTTGAGAQLKVVDALAHGRVVVATPHTLGSVPPALRSACVVAEGAHGIASAVVTLLEDVPRRHAMENLLRGSRGVPTWHDAAAPLIGWVSGHAASRR